MKWNDHLEGHLYWQRLLQRASKISVTLHSWLAAFYPTDKHKILRFCRQLTSLIQSILKSSKRWSLSCAKSKVSSWILMHLGIMHTTGWAQVYLHVQFVWPLYSNITVIYIYIYWLQKWSYGNKTKTRWVVACVTRFWVWWKKCQGM